LTRAPHPTALALSLVPPARSHVAETSRTPSLRSPKWRKALRD
jgi:hypothetical protein